MKFLYRILPLLLLFPAMAGCDKNSFTIAPMDVRGTIGIVEVHWAGSIKSDGTVNDPDDDFVEVKNYTNGVIDFSGWVIKVTGDGVNNAFTIPSGTVLASDEYLTIGSKRSGAFPALDVVFDDFKLPNTPFYLQVNDGSGLSSDAADFTLRSWLPGGSSLPLMKKSAVRRVTFYGPEDGFQLYNWMTYNASAPSGSLNGDYLGSVLASPGEEVPGEGFEQEDL